METDLRGWRFRPTLWPTLIAAPAVCILIGLGLWQLDRLEWKTGLLARIGDSMAMAAVDMPAAFADPPAWDYRRVRIEGVYLHDRELYLTARTHRGRAGGHVIAPLRRTDGVAAGQVILVDRGWVPDDRRDPATRTGGQPAGTVTVEGVLRRPPERGWLQPDNQPADNLWFWVDLPAMAAAAGLPTAPALILEAVADAPGEALPVGGQTRVALPNDHLQYALTWFALAAALAAIYGLYHLRRPPDRTPDPTT